VTTEKDSSASQFSQRQDCVPESIAISLSVPWPRWTVRPILSKWQIAADHSPAGAGERSRHSNQQGRIGIRSSAMRQHQAGSSSIDWTMKKSANRRIQRVIVKVFVGSRHAGKPANRELETIKLQPVL
jgi:hypothetical protein